MKKVLFLIPVALFICLSGCAEKDFYAGEKISIEEIELLKSDFETVESRPVFEETTIAAPETEIKIETTVEQPETETEKTVETTLPENEETAKNEDFEVRTYYWTPNGEKYHLYKNCSTLSRSKTILSGTLEECKAAGKSGLCKTCAKK